MSDRRPAPRGARSDARAPRLAAVALLAAVAGCDKNAEEWSRFNATTDVLEIQVGAEVGDPVTIELHSTTGSNVVGEATVTPGSGPVGTDHEVTVLVADEYEAVIERVSVQSDAGDRGVEVHELVQDSAEHGLWWRILTSVGEEGETRTDTFEVQLWEPVAESAEAE